MNFENELNFMKDYEIITTNRADLERREIK